MLHAPRLYQNDEVFFIIIVIIIHSCGVFFWTDLLTTNEQEIKLQQSYRAAWYALIAEIVSFIFTENSRALLRFSLIMLKE